MKDKVVFVLGAGFSKEAKAPSQEDLIKEIFKTHKDYPFVIGDDKMREFKDVLRKTFNIPEEFQETIPLEDLFTPLDRCLQDNISFRNLDVIGIKKFRSLIFELIGKTLNHLLESPSKGYINNFASYLVKLASQRTLEPKSDRVAVISTNWDILLDNAIHEELRNKNDLAVVDYCCYISSNKVNDEHVKPGLEVLAKGGYNVKLLKLHGSLNWLQCPRCQRIYAEFFSKIAMQQFQPDNRPSCRHCNENFGVQKSNSHGLVSNLIMPTFLKDLSNPQYKIIWQNAGIELSEAKKVIFIGYSLPSADFEMRQLLSRMIDVKTEIEVVDFKSANDNGVNYNSVVKRYNQFFGREIKCHQEGTEKYINTELLNRV